MTRVLHTNMANADNSQKNISVEFIDTILERLAHREKLINNEVLNRQKQIQIMSVQQLYEEAEQKKIQSLMSKIQNRILQNRDFVLVESHEIPITKISSLKTAGYSLSSPSYKDEYIIITWDQPYEYRFSRHSLY